MTDTTWESTDNEIGKKVLFEASNRDDTTLECHQGTGHGHDDADGKHGSDSRERAVKGAETGIGAGRRAP
jgi:hypothetical protein